ncbi:uncharacterized protein LOC128873864 isoform X1 [Hylaeus volcanicus]|uniref:uncharacterized protein LOC128873864 isoform X1 n=1 Tax=Hylaeus volcanicus TaxID=313075 RepID=UPI0023B831FC|nr:uncharacterized protein LOC128873864 isoform X1 [Hylaeus volcanicus]XP_053973792.1 uncharacterized protein LOC128873864 isoform X1 [Hylaeus volcanicus]XP_053973793.1 uncharacterized protein LOC128873864 isoform X1 [Hylaeus volcanicus]
MRRTFGIKSILRIGVIVIVCRFDPSIGLPTEQPTRFTLNTGDGDVSSTTATTLTTSRLDQGRELLGRVADAIRIVTGRLVNSVTLARNIIIDRAETLVSDSQNNVDTVIAEKTEDPNKTQRSLETIQNMPVTNTRTDTREIVRLETERAQGFLERPVYKPITGILESLFRPTPLVDGIKEQEKYGNSGDKFIGIGRALVNSFEGFSNFLNAVVDLPRNAAKTTSRGITEALNHVGARLIGLE